MWRATNSDGTLTYSFVESVKASYPFWSIRLLGGVLFLSGMVIMFYNVLKTIAGEGIQRTSSDAASGTRLITENFGHGSIETRVYQSAA